MPVTVLNVDGETAAKSSSAPQPKDDEARADVEGAAEQVAAVADEAIASDADTGDATAADIHVATRINDGDLEKVLTDSSEKGHDLLFVGVEPLAGADGGFDDRLSSMTSAFKGTAMIVSSRGRRMPQDDQNIRILVPTSGTERSTRAAEFAFLIAKVTGCSITVLNSPGFAGDPNS
jgi:hypothetical protein